jgi:SAM-dependent methyltransferase
MFGITQGYGHKPFPGADRSPRYCTLAPIYDEILGDDFFPQLRRNFERLVRFHGIRFSSVADVACGTGTFVRYLCARGVPVVYGVDRSPEMLRVAVAKNHGTDARFLIQEFATLRLPRPVDLITCHFDSLNYLLTADDLLRALRRFQANVKPAGHVIFDMITDRPPWHGPGPRVERVNGRDVPVVRITCWDPRRSIQTALVSIGRNGRSQQEIHVQRGYPVALVAGLLAQAGFALLGSHDFQTLGPATIRTPRAVYVARVRDACRSPSTP